MTLTSITCASGSPTLEAHACLKNSSAVSELTLALLLIPDFPYKIMKLLYSLPVTFQLFYPYCNLQIPFFTICFMYIIRRFLMFPHFTFSGTAMSLGFAPQTHFILYLRHTDHSPCLKCSVCFCCRKKYKTGKRNRFSHRDKFCHFPFAGAGCHLTPVVKPVTGKQFYPDLSL